MHLFVVLGVEVGDLKKSEQNVHSNCEHSFEYYSLSLLGLGYGLKELLPNLSSE